MSNIPFNPQRLRQLCLGKTRRLMAGNYGFGQFRSENVEINYEKSYVYINNGAKILAVAHCDTVDHKPTFSRATLTGETCYFSPAMDDRLGVYTILDVLPQLGLKYDVLLTTDEERGLSTAANFTAKKNYHWMFEFDRRGTGAVYYQYDKTKLRDDGDKFFRHDFGSFSDISELWFLGCAGINVATGYYSEHTYYCHMLLEDWREQVERFVRFYHAHKDDVYTFTGGRYSNFYDNYSSGTYANNTTATNTTTYAPKALPSSSHSTVPEYVKDWLRTQDKAPSFRNFTEYNEFVEHMPSEVWRWIDDAWILDRDPGHPNGEVPWWNWWMASNHEKVTKEPKKTDALDYSADDVLRLHNKYVQDREKYVITKEHPLNGILCENCVHNKALFLKDGIYLCEDCDDEQWYANFYNPNSNNGG